MRWIISVLLAVVPVNLHAQSAESRGYVFAGLSVPFQQGVTTDEYRTYLAAPGGWSVGILVGGGARVTDFFSVEGALHRTGVMEAIEPSRYFITYSAERRDTIIAMGARVHLHISKRVALEPVGSLEFVREESWLAQRRDVMPGSPSDGDLSQHSPFVNSWGRGLAGGMDVRFGRGHLAALPGVRVHRFWRGEDAVSTWPGGRSNWGMELVMAARVDF